MDHSFKVSLSRLEKEGTIQIDERVGGDFVEVHERDLDFVDPLRVKGQLEHAGSALLVKFSLETKAQSPCIICGKHVKIGVNVKDVCHAEPLEDIRGQEFDYSGLIRDVLLTETPKYAECAGGCSERDNLKQYLNEGTSESQQPFRDLDFEIEN